MKSFSLLVLVASMSIFGFACASGQRLESDTAKWLKYEVRSEGLNVSLKVPPNHRFKERPAAYSIAIDPAKREALLFSAQYDYGRRSSGDLAQFEVIYSIVRLFEGLPEHPPLADFRASLSRAIQVTAPRVSLKSGKWSVEPAPATLPLSWMRSFDPQDPLQESYATLCAPDLAVVVTPLFYGNTLAKNAQWIQGRQALFRKMLAEVRCY